MPEIVLNPPDSSSFVRQPRLKRAALLRTDALFGFVQGESRQPDEF
jgi:hypothetical protein